jgi:hypothetical protein
MLLPYDTTMNLFLTAVPIYEWAPEPPASTTGEAGAAAPSSDDAAEAGNSLPPPLRLVFKGVRWVAVPVWGMRENPAWDQVAQDRRDEDERHNLERTRRGQPVPNATDPSSESTAAGGSE